MPDQLTLPPAAPSGIARDRTSQPRRERSPRSRSWALRRPRADRGTPRQEGGPPQVQIAADRCVGCLACADVCRPAALHLMSGAWAVVADEARCSGCRRCVGACPFGVIAVSGAVRTRHQLVLDNLRSTLASHCPPGWRVHAARPASGPAPGLPLPAPDLAVVRHEHADEPWPPHDPATVALVVEVVAPSTRADDLGCKREVYRERGIPAYWTVDQREGEVTVHWAGPAAWFDRWSRTSFG